ncbi:MAG: HEAT repeat domain-containing protein, partial [Elusimicrobia bacterium]|nr:HEAT repeat domain-containing protein [Elusimicrobiota bacterium]
FADACKKSLAPDQLRDLLKDADPEVRKAAVKSARTQIQNSYAADRVLEILKDKSERADIRVEAARTLSYAPGYVKTQDALVDLLKYGSNEPAALRVMAYKALWGAAAANPRYMDFLLDAVKYSEKDAAARRAAIWALFGASANFRAQQLLVDILKYGNENEAVKIEAIKSLYGAIGVFTVKDLFQNIVESDKQAKSVRLAALKALSGAAGDSSVQRFIADMIRSERDQELRVAAVEAANPDLAGLREFFHLGYNVENGGFVSPIEKE